MAFVKPKDGNILSLTRVHEIINRTDYKISNSAKSLHPRAGPDNHFPLAASFRVSTRSEIMVPLSSLNALGAPGDKHAGSLFLEQSAQI